MARNGGGERSRGSGSTSGDRDRHAQGSREGSSSPHDGHRLGRNAWRRRPSPASSSSSFRDARRSPCQKSTDCRRSLPGGSRQAFRLPPPAGGSPQLRAAAKIEATRAHFRIMKSDPTTPSRPSRSAYSWAANYSFTPRDSRRLFEAVRERIRRGRGDPKAAPILAYHDQGPGGRGWSGDGK